MITTLNTSSSKSLQLSTKLKENIFLDRDEYPTTISDMYELLVKTVSTTQIATKAAATRDKA